jgi:DNA-binding transcriptional MerR regulator
MVQAGHVNDADLMLPGEFGAATRLSPKALRLYAEQGLLISACTDPGTRYRRYHSDQIPRARLIGWLRALHLPLTRIAVLVTLSPQARQAELRAWLAAQETSLQHQRELIEALDGTGHPVASSPTLRTRPQRKLLSREQRVHIDQLPAFIAASAPAARSRSGPGPAAPCSMSPTRWPPGKEAEPCTPMPVTDRTATPTR